MQRIENEVTVKVQHNIKTKLKKSNLFMYGHVRRIGEEKDY